MIKLLSSEDRNKIELMFNKYGKTIYNNDKNLKSEWEIHDMIIDIWEMGIILNEIEKYKIITNRTKSWRIKKKNKKRYNKKCEEIGYLNGKI